MLPAFIIIVCLALAFIIIVRRLPKAMDFDGDTASTRPPVIDRPASRLHSLPKIPNLPRLKFNFRMPRLPKRVPKPDRATGEPPKADQFWQAEKTPASLEPVLPTAKQRPTATESATEDLEASKPIPAPVARPIAPPDRKKEPLTLGRSRSRDPLQEAEDAFAIKDYRKAEKLYLKLAAENPRNPKVYGRLGIIYMEQKNHEDARDALQQAIKLEPGVASRHFNLALTYIQLGSKIKAVNAMEAALKYEPANRKYRKMLDDVLSGRNF